ncbi:peptidylprolyl isomerase [Halodesulfurarchaeum sp. HSR-GB]|uniref:FKBP-type peptidyl-prolyl cis-trans isomerase n=1 Tax=Halodesulfurarchaeum sp. HSR-GB TaxID=3074077 RepID=UPI0028672632|nr:peptidylprolyl isomerase [Halodesulfurarchaeum sp. HSR-GB]MDR5655657.1 peptidylprolyl isomerase [Halodesulfurarchaeum sp. HSR-GB]
MAIESGDTVRIEYTGRLEDGTVFDTSRRAVAEEHDLVEEDREYDPLEAAVGTGQFIEGLDEALLGMDAGESATVTVPPAEAYGEWEESRVREYEIDELSAQLGDQLPEAGAYIQTPDGSVAEIRSVEEDVVRVDFNHRLAGETLEFEIEVLAVE